MGVLVRTGAEAALYQATWHGIQVMKKVRLPKPYRLPQLDRDLRRSRTIHEAQLLSDAKRAGVSTPLLYHVDVAHATLVMEYVDGPRVKELLPNLPCGERRLLCYRIGGLIGRLHGAGIIHGDLTTSNMIQRPNDRIVFIDFGLAEYSTAVEKRGVDIHLLKRALESTHYRHAKACYAAILTGYAHEASPAQAKDVVTRVREISRRGRYTGS
jgi:TP53 regulating kinase-like protein